MVMAADQQSPPLTPPPPPPPPPIESDSDAELLPSLDEAEAILGYRFNNRMVLEEALTHPSHPSATTTFSYERLEYVGDSVLNLLVTKEQYFLYPGLPPGTLTRLRAANVNTEKLARVAVKLGLHRFLRHRKHLLDKQISDFREEIKKFPLHSNGLVDVPKVLADIVESTIGAVFIDSNLSLETVWSVFKGLLEPNISPQTLEIHPVTELLELCQKRGWIVEFKDLWKEKTTYDVFIEGQFAGRAAYPLKKEIACNRAAKDALDHITRVLQHRSEDPTLAIDCEIASANEIGLVLDDLHKNVVQD